MLLKKHSFSYAAIFVFAPLSISAAQKSSPNNLVIMTDQQRRDTLRFSGPVRVESRYSKLPSGLMSAEVLKTKPTGYLETVKYPYSEEIKLRIFKDLS